MDVAGNVILMVVFVASFVAICWCMYRLGKIDGFERGWAAGVAKGYLDARDFYEDILDKMHERARKEVE